MLARASAVFLLALPFIAVAIPTEGGSCTTGPVSCCNQLLAPSDLDAPTIQALGSLGVVVKDLNGLVGINCLSILGLGSNSCTSQNVCCDKTFNGGLINIDCNVINV